MTSRFNPIIALLILHIIIGCTPSEKQQADKSMSSEIKANKQVVCFVYHRFGDSRYPSTNISLENFEAHLKYLKQNDFTLMRFSAAIDYLQSASPAKKVAVITIDDGYTSFFENGLPLLKKYNFPASLYINTQSVGNQGYMSWEEIKEASHNNIEIGNHTHSHAYFLDQAPKERYDNFRNELEKCQEVIRNHLGKAPETFAYPFGELDPKMQEIVKATGFKAAAAQNSGVIYQGTHLMRCPRFPMSEAYASPKKFAAKAEMKALPVINQTPMSFIPSQGEVKPKLQLKLEADSLQLDQLQCFIQGGNCNTSLEQNGGTTLTIQAKQAISSRRRTLYTITLPDKNGQWHWYSHLWIYPD